MSLVLASLATCAAAAPDALLVIPRRQRTVEFAFDIQRLREVEIVCYDTALDANNPLLYRWDRGLRAWNPVSLAAYRSGELFRPLPARVFVLGDRVAEVDMMS